MIMNKDDKKVLNDWKIEQQKKDFGRAGKEIINIFKKTKENKGEN